MRGRRVMARAEGTGGHRREPSPRPASAEFRIRQCLGVGSEHVYEMNSMVYGVDRSLDRRPVSHVRVRDWSSAFLLAKDRT